MMYLSSVSLNANGQIFFDIFMFVCVCVWVYIFPSIHVGWEGGLKIPR